MCAAKDFDDLLGCIKRRDLLLMVSLCRPEENKPIDLSFLEYLLRIIFAKLSPKSPTAIKKS